MPVLKGTVQFHRWKIVPQAADNFDLFIFSCPSCPFRLTRLLSPALGKLAKVAVDIMTTKGVPDATLTVLTLALCHFDLDFASPFYLSIPMTGIHWKLRQCDISLYHSP